MEAANNSSPIGRIIPVLLVFFGLIALYYLYQYLFGPRSSNAYSLLFKTQAANTDPSQPIVITSDKLPSLYEGGEFTVSAWIYITNWSYRAGFNKSILSVGGPNFDILYASVHDKVYKRKVKIQGANNFEKPIKPANPKL